ncbi:MAG: hypothetical protein BGO13_09185 [Burkholderiales bacterium 66-5]|nr:MAG: hypothetical protein BGO13_09185 [Burkholderiales bacterium 66-5]
MNEVSIEVAEDATDATASFIAECMSVGRESAAAGLRMDKKAPAAYRDGFLAYRGPRTSLTYFEGKLLNLRLSAVRRGMLVDQTVTAQLLERITDGRCPVTLERFRWGAGSHPETRPWTASSTKSATGQETSACCLSASTAPRRSCRLSMWLSSHKRGNHMGNFRLSNGCDWLR